MDPTCAARGATDAFLGRGDLTDRNGSGAADWLRAPGWGRPTVASAALAKGADLVRRMSRAKPTPGAALVLGRAQRGGPA